MPEPRGPSRSFRPPDGVAKAKGNLETTGAAQVTAHEAALAAAESK